MGSIESSEADGTTTVTMSAPEKQNSLTREACEAMVEELTRAAGDDDCRCVVIEGAGDAFSAGADVGQLSGKVEEDDVLGLTDMMDEAFHELIETIAEMKKPVVAKVSGNALGAGANIAVACDFVYAGDSATFGWPFAGLGAGPDTGTTYFLPRMVGERVAMELILLGDQIPAERAAELDLVTEVVPTEDLDEHVTEVATKLAASPTRALGESKRLIRESHAHTLSEVLENERRVQGLLFGTEDLHEGISAFAERRQPEFEGR